MFAFIVRRLLQSLVIVIVMTLIVFFGVNVTGDPAELSTNFFVNQDEIKAAIHTLEPGRPVYQQYWYFLANATQGEFGNSFIFAEPALQLILQKMPATLELAFAAMVIAIVFGIPLGLYAGLHPDFKAAKLIVTSSILSYSLPTFWVGLVLIMVFSVMLGWLPSSGQGETRLLFGVPVSFLTWDGLQHLLLPALSLALLKISLIIRLSHFRTRKVLLRNHNKFAHVREFARGRADTDHLLKSIMIAVLAMPGLALGGVFAFTVVAEAVFAWPGMGKLLVDSIQSLDRPVIAAYLMITVILFIAFNLTVDICFSLLDRRGRLQDCRR